MLVYRGWARCLGAPRHRGTSTRRSRTRFPREKAGFPVMRLPRVRRIYKDAANRPGIPIGLARSRRYPTFGQPPSHLAQRQTLYAYPSEYLAYHAGLFQDDVVPRLAVSVLLANITVAVRRISQDAHFALPRREPATASSPFQNLSAFVFRKGALHLDQQVSFVRLVLYVLVQEDYFDAVFVQFLQQQHLVRMLARQAIRRVNVNAIKAARISQVAQSLQRGTQ